MSRRRTRCLEIVFAGLACACVASCGGVTETQDPPPVPIASRAFVHLLDTRAEALRTYDVSEMTAQLAPVASVGAPGAALLAVQPSGGVLYTLGKATEVGASTLRSFALDARTGALTALAQERLGYCKFRFLTVSSERLFAGGELRLQPQLQPLRRLRASPRRQLLSDANADELRRSGRVLSASSRARAPGLAYLRNTTWDSPLLTAHAPTEDGTFVLQERETPPRLIALDGPSRRAG